MLGKQWEERKAGEPTIQPQAIPAELDSERHSSGVAREAGGGGSSGRMTATTVL